MSRDVEAVNGDAPGRDLAGGDVAAGDTVAVDSAAHSAVTAALHRAGVLLAAGRPEEAERGLRSAQGEAPRDARLLIALSQAVLEQGRAADAAGLARAAVAARPAAVTWQNLAAVLLAGDRDPDGALEAARQAIRLEPRRPEPYGLAALSLSVLPGYQGDRLEAARGLARTALELAPRSVPVLAAAGEVERFHDPFAARARYQEALAVEPLDRALLERSAQLSDGTDAERAALGRAAVRLDPVNARAWGELAGTVSSGLRRFGVLGQACALVTALAAVWLPGWVAAVVGALAQLQVLVGAGFTMATVTGELPREFVRDVLWGTRRARVAGLSHLATPVLAMVGAAVLLVRGGEARSGGAVLGLAVLALAPATWIRLGDLYGQVPVALRRQTSAAVRRRAGVPPWTPAAVATVVALAGAFAATGHVAHPEAFGVFAALAGLVTLPPAVARVVAEPGRPAPGAVLALVAGVAELVLGVLVVALEGSA